ncbi:MAG: histidine kinase [Flammeovirgaceae bacterium]|nr:histidine kinase [Flammeovirgaceae bacterium]MBE63737.1 histidine kinase [Flammeovirgaceae bacterium]MBR06939.1 histidine kinase [Rickettsiales bacterium]HCX23782.1 histidine kinase [Cytophagales bacterium]
MNKLKEHRETIGHILFWVGYFSFNSVRWGHYFGDYVYSIKSNLVEFPIHIILCYFNLYWLVPKFLSRKNFTYYVLALFFSVLFMSLIRIVLNYLLVTTNIWPESAFEETNLFGLSYIISVFVGELYIVGVTAAIKLTIDRVRERDAQRELEKNSLETELAYLKTQIQPHFFFNTLNSLYALTLEKSEMAPNTILKLSNMMSFVIYRAKADVVSLMETVTHMKNFIELEKIRFGSKLNVDFEISGELDGKIPPLILSPFVENSIKHGGLSPADTIDIQIKLHVEEKHLIFEVENWLKDYKDSEENERLNGEGIGLENTIRRLKLLYKDDYKLDINQENQKYKIHLTLPLNE